MYFWKVDALVKDFKAGEVTQKEQLKYYLAFIVACTLATQLSGYVDTVSNVYDMLSNCLELVLGVAGIVYCYKINSTGDDKDFIARMVCIGFPVMIRLISVLFPIMVIISVLGEVLSPTRSDSITESTLVDVMAISAFIALSYWYTSLKIRDVSTLSS
ncbi:MAG: hypothetical protein ACKE5Q_03995 [Methylophilaceae bacterium]